MFLLQCDDVALLRTTKEFHVGSQFSSCCREGRVELVAAADVTPLSTSDRNGSNPTRVPG